MLDIKDTFIILLLGCGTRTIWDKFKKGTKWVDDRKNGCYEFLLETITFKFSNYCERLEIYKFKDAEDVLVYDSIYGWSSTRQYYDETMLILEKMEAYISGEKQRNRQNAINDKINKKRLKIFEPFITPEQDKNIKKKNYYQKIPLKKDTELSSIS